MEVPEKRQPGNHPHLGSTHAHCIIVIAGYLERTKIFEHIVKEVGHLEDPQELKMLENKMVSVFVMDKCMRNICLSSKNTVIRSLVSLGVKPQGVIKGTGFFIWDVQLPTAEDCLGISRRELITKDLI